MLNNQQPSIGSTPGELQISKISLLRESRLINCHIIGLVKDLITSPLFPEKLRYIGKLCGSIDLLRINFCFLICILDANHLTKISLLDIDKPYK